MHSQRLLCCSCTIEPEARPALKLRQLAPCLSRSVLEHALTFCTLTPPPTHTQVVVDSDSTGRVLLSKGGLTKRVTIIPLNQVTLFFLGVGWGVKYRGACRGTCCVTPVPLHTCACPVRS